MPAGMGLAFLLFLNKGPENILVFAGQRVSVATTQPCPFRTKTAIDKTIGMAVLQKNFPKTRNCPLLDVGPYII